MPATTFASPIEFARIVGTDRSRVCRWIKEGKIDGEALVGSGRERRIDVDLAKAQLAKRRDPGQALGNGAKTRLRPAAAPAAAPPPPPKAVAALKPGRVKGKRRRPAPEAAPEPEPASALDGDDVDSLDYAAQRARLAKAQADAQEMKNAIARKELLSAEEVVRGWSEIVAWARTCVMAVPGRVRDALPHLQPSDIAKIDAEIRRALTEASHGEQP